jgi:hypothetical protein
MNKSDYRMPVTVALSLLIWRSAAKSFIAAKGLGKIPRAVALHIAYIALRANVQHCKGTPWHSLVTVASLLEGNESTDTGELVCYLVNKALA